MTCWWFRTPVEIEEEYEPHAFKCVFCQHPWVIRDKPVLPSRWGGIFPVAAVHRCRSDGARGEWGDCLNNTQLELNLCLG